MKIQNLHVTFFTCKEFICKFEEHEESTEEVIESLMRSDSITFSGDLPDSAFLLRLDAATFDRYL